MPRSKDLDGILKSLRSSEVSVREKAQGDLFRLRHQADHLTVADGLKALRAAAETYPFDKPTPEEVSEDLVDVAARNSRPEYIPVVVELFDKFSSKAKWSALVILASLENQEAAIAYMEVVRKHAKTGGIPRLVTGPLENGPRHADVFFPEILNYANIPSLTADIYRLCLSYVEAELVSDEQLEPFTGQVVTHYRDLDDKLRPVQRDEGIGWMWEEPYIESRIEAGMLLDLFGHFPVASVENDLRQALERRDPRLQYFAAVSLMRLGQNVDSKYFGEIAAHSEMRTWLYQELRRRSQLALLPEKYLTQAALAESDMVHWLTYPTELGRVPDEIELMKVFPIDTGLTGGIYDYYLFRFRTHEPHWAAKNGWIAGISGPFRRDEQPSTDALGDTFSTFDKWDSKSPEEHIGDIREIMERWKEFHASQNE